MSRTPWMTSDDIIEAVKRKISFPISEQTFSEDDILKFASEEMMISQVPSVLEFHEEYYVSFEIVPLVSGKSRYPIPSRAIGMKLRDLFWADDQTVPGQPYGNLFEMTRILPDDKAYYQRNSASSQQISIYYIEGDDVVITPSTNTATSGSLVFFYYLRPNQLVQNDRAATATEFQKNITFNNATLVSGDIIYFNDTAYTAVSGSPATNQFQIGATSILTATNFCNLINTTSFGSASNGTPSTAIATVSYSDFTLEFVSVSLGISISSSDIVVFDAIPDNITDSSYIDFLQKKGGHKLISFDTLISATGISSNSITFADGEIPETFVIGDYICTQYESIIPWLPDDLHTGLAERTSARVLAALGDSQGLAISTQKIAEIERRQGNIVDNRVEGSALKVTARHSLLRRGGMNSRKRL